MTYKKGFDYYALKIFGDQKRQNITIPIFAIFLSFIIGGIIMLLLGKNPFTTYYAFLQGAGVAPKPKYASYKGMFTDFMAMLDALTPMIFAALSVAVAFKAGLFNICVSGQMLFSGFVATILVGYTDISPFIAKPLVIIIGAIAGGLIGALIGYLKYRFNINEVVTSIMFNYIIMYILAFFINKNYLDPVSRQSKYVTASSRLTLVSVPFMGYKVDVPLGIVLAVIAVFVIKFILDKTKLGFEIKTVGSNKNAAMYAGINVGRNIIFTMFLSGLLAGLAGVTYYLGYFASMQPNVLTQTGFNAIAVSLLGNSNPIGIIFSSLLITILDTGSTYMSSTMGVQREIAGVLTGIILLFSACSAYFRYILNQIREKEEEKLAESKSLEKKGVASNE